MLKKIFLTLILIVLTLTACQSPAEDEVTREGDPFAIYLIDDEQVTGPGAQTVDINQLPLAQEPIIGMDDIVSYDWQLHGINLTDEAYFRLVGLFMGGLPLSGVPFVVTYYQEPLYVGAFWAYYSTLRFNGVVIMQPVDPAGQTLYIVLGYPGEADFTGEDPRNDPRILEVFEEAGILR